LDTRNHLPLPAEFDHQFKDALYITQGFERNIMVLTQRAFEQIYRTVMSLNLADPLARLLLRMILGTAHEAKIEPGGGIFLPDSLKEFASLTRNVVLVGLGDYFEIWSIEQWNQQEEKLSNVEANSDRFSTLVIATR
jgi:MraZ protein